ncbi:MAG: DUF2924 domain-containing protein [Candidatus Krumholzibacteria bacterium]|nr:DUF2924 domain-containing protein [Candidatus Krumholzibacteria bacterium]
MEPGIMKEIRALRQMTTGELRGKYRELFGEESRSYNKRFLERRIAWQIQALAEGGLSERALQRAEELADDSYLRTRAPKITSNGTSEGKSRTAVRSFSSSHDRRLPMPGTVLTREYKGGRISVTVLDEGFEFDGELYRSLTAVSKAITGSHWNGYHFFGLKKGRR